jgi:Flp pilus assembly CpaF family ATPase
MSFWSSWFKSKPAQTVTQQTAGTVTQPLQTALVKLTELLPDRSTTEILVNLDQVVWAFEHKVPTATTLYMTKGQSLEVVETIADIVDRISGR